MMGGKRGNSEGTIYQRSDGRWEAALSLSNGKRKRLYARTRQEAARRLAEATRNRDQGLLQVSDERQTLRQYLIAWLHTAQPTIAATTWERYASLVQLHIIPTLGHVQLTRLTPQQVQRLISERLATGLSPYSVHNMRAVLRRALAESQLHGLISRNPVAVVRPPKTPYREMQVYTPEQARQLMEASRGHRLEALITLAVSTGMRQGELLGLRWRDVNLDDAYLQVRVQLQKARDRGLALKHVKTAAGRRKIALSRFAVDALCAHRARQIEERLAAGPLWKSLDLVFSNSQGGYLYKSNVLAEFYQPAVRKAGLPLIRFHDLRHTAATLMLLQGINPKVVSEMLGHASIGITLDLYSHVLPDMQKEAAAALDRLLRG